MAITDQITNFYEQAKQKLGLPNKITSMPILPTEPNKVAGMLIELVSDAQNYRDQFYFNRLGYQDGSKTPINPMIFWAYCHALETGDHWRVWGSRRKNDEESWKAELVENEIGDQIRVVSRYLTANWHGFTVTPNVAHINEILQQEQKRTDWSNISIEMVKRAAKYGTAIVKSVMNFDVDPRGIATEIVCDNAGILVSPFTTGLSKAQGCWYIAHKSTQPIWSVLQVHREDMRNLGVNESMIKPISVDKASTTDHVSTYLIAPTKYNYTRSTATEYIEFFMDDFTDIPAQFNPEEFKASVQNILHGGKPPINPYTNHQQMIENYLKFMSEKNSMATDPSTTEEDHQILDEINNRIALQIQAHMRYRIDGMTPQNPNGRKVVMAGGVVVQDVPNPYHFDWRNLYHWINYESVDGQLWGRGLTEILWSTNKSLDLMKSRIADMGMFAVPEVWLSHENKAFFTGKNKYVKDPTQLKFYMGAPPVSPQSRAPMEFLETFKIDKESASRKAGVNSITYGEDPGADISGKAINILTDQNSIMVTGQANLNFGAGVEDIIETRLKMMKQFYTEERLFRINGKYVPITVSDILKEQPSGEIGEDGKPIMQPIPDIEVSVKPDSNLPNAWENDLSTLIKIAASQPTQPGEAPLVPREAIYDLMGERFTEFQEGGKYRKIDQATQIGLQVMAQQEQERMAQEEQQKVVDSVAKSNFRAKLKERTAPKPTNGNGTH